MSKNSCKINKVDGKNIIIAGDSGTLQMDYRCQEELCKTLVEPKNMNFEKIKKHIEETISFYKKKECSRDALLRNIPSLLADMNMIDPSFVQKTIFKLKKIGIDENEIWKLIYEDKEKEYSGDYFKNEYVRVKKNMLDQLDSKLKRKPVNQEIIEDIKSTTEYLNKNKVELPDRGNSMRDDILSSYIGKTTTYIYLHNPSKKELKYVVSINPLLATISN